MNKTKRGLELAAAIITIIGASLLALIMLITLGGISKMNEDAYNSADLTLLAGIVGILLCISIIMIVFGGILCTNPNKNGVYKSRMGISITVLVLLGLMSIITIDGLELFVLYATPFGLLLASICMKHNKNVACETSLLGNTQNNQSTSGIEEQLRKLKKLRDMNILDEEQYKSAIKKIIDLL